MWPRSAKISNKKKAERGKKGVYDWIGHGGSIDDSGAVKTFSDGGELKDRLKGRSCGNVLRAVDGGDAYDTRPEGTFLKLLKEPEYIARKGPLKWDDLRR